MTAGSFAGLLTNKHIVLRTFCFLAVLVLVVVPTMGQQDNFQRFNTALTGGGYVEALNRWQAFSESDKRQLSQDARFSPEQWDLARLQRDSVQLNRGQISQLFDVYQDLDRYFPAQRHWLKALGLATLLYQDSLPTQVMPTLQRCLTEAPVEMPSLFFETYSELFLQELEADTTGEQLDRRIADFLFWENLALNQPVLYPELAQQVPALQLRMAETLQTQMPNCQDLAGSYQEALNRDLLQPINYQFIYTALRLKGCPGGAFRDSIYTRFPSVTQTTTVYRIVAEEAAGRGDFLNALRWLEKSAEAETHPRFQARDYLRLAQVYQARQNFRTARLYVERAHASYPEWGVPFLFLAEMVVQSGPFCNFTHLEQKGVYWLAIDYCEQAMNLNPRLHTQAVKQIQAYRAKMPTKDEVLFYGLQIGDSFPLRCWLETATRVRYK